MGAALTKLARLVRDTKGTIAYLNDEISSFNVGDRPMSPPVRLLRALFAAQASLAELEQKLALESKAVVAEISHALVSYGASTPGSSSYYMCINCGLYSHTLSLDAACRPACGHEECLTVPGMAEDCSRARIKRVGGLTHPVIELRRSSYGNTGPR